MACDQTDAAGFSKFVGSDGYTFICRTSTKYWYYVPDFPGPFGAFSGAVGTGSVRSVVQYLVLLR